jgi:hypothetical protein
MQGHTWKITLNEGDYAGEELFVRADRCYTEGNAIYFQRDVEKTEADPFPESLLVAYLPADRVFQIDIVDDETEETAGFFTSEE